MKSVGFQISDTAVSCVRISSMLQNKMPDTFAEIGWYEDPGDLIVKCPPTSGKPKMLIFGAVNGFPKCDLNSPRLRCSEPL
jgi:hypothetical protein